MCLFVFLFDCLFDCLLAWFFGWFLTVRIFLNFLLYLSFQVVESLCRLNDSAATVVVRVSGIHSPAGACAGHVYGRRCIFPVDDFKAMVSSLPAPPPGSYAGNLLRKFVALLGKHSEPMLSMPTTAVRQTRWVCTK